MSATMVASFWYLCMCILMVRDPIVRRVLQETCLQFSKATLMSFSSLIYFGGHSFSRSVLLILRSLRRFRIITFAHANPPTFPAKLKSNVLATSSSHENALHWYEPPVERECYEEDWSFITDSSSSCITDED